MTVTISFQRWISNRAIIIRWQVLLPSSKFLIKFNFTNVFNELISIVTLSSTVLEASHNGFWFLTIIDFHHCALPHYYIMFHIHVVIPAYLFWYRHLALSLFLCITDLKCCSACMVKVLSRYCFALLKKMEIPISCFYTGIENWLYGQGSRFTPSLLLWLHLFVRSRYLYITNVAFCRYCLLWVGLYLAGTNHMPWRSNLSNLTRFLVLSASVRHSRSACSSCQVTEFRNGQYTFFHFFSRCCSLMLRKLGTSWVTYCNCCFSICHDGSSFLKIVVVDGALRYLPWFVGSVNKKMSNCKFLWSLHRSILADSVTSCAFH